MEGLTKKERDCQGGRVWRKVEESIGRINGDGKRRDLGW